VGGDWGAKAELSIGVQKDWSPGEELKHLLHLFHKRISVRDYSDMLRQVLTRKGVRATVVTAGHCTHAELTIGHALASCYSGCVHTLPGLCLCQLTS